MPMVYMPPASSKRSNRSAWTEVPQVARRASWLAYEAKLGLTYVGRPHALEVLDVNALLWREVVDPPGAKRASDQLPKAGTACN
jgi:hypothetical protein